MRLKRKHRDAISFYGFISPWIIGFIVFSVIPMALSLYYSFMKVKVISIGRKPPDFVGITNYIRAFTNDPDFLASIGNTFRFTLFKVLFTIVVSLAFALLLNQIIPLKRFFRTMIYLPAIIPVVGSALLWQLLFSNDLSLINYIFSFVGIPPVNWISMDNAMNSVILMSTWGTIGPTMTILLAALQGVPNDLYEAVTIDGGGFKERLFNVTLPLISPTILYVVITGLISGLQVYAETKLLTNGGPGIVTTTMSMLIVNNAFADDALGMGYACAQAWVLFVITLVFTAIFFAFANRFIYYEGGDRK
jgi:multiple sugar transport system permease protein